MARKNPVKVIREGNFSFINGSWVIADWEFNCGNLPYYHPYDVVDAVLKHIAKINRKQFKDSLKPKGIVYFEPVVDSVGGGG